MIHTNVEALGTIASELTEKHTVLIFVTS